MYYRTFGRGDAVVSEIGFGGWGIGGARDGAAAYGPTDDAASLAALQAAYDAGVTFYDTADLYGFGHSESLIGEALGDYRPHVFLATKAGFRDAQRQDFSPAHLRQALEQSLRRLRTDYVDLFQLHSPPVAQLHAEPEIIDCLHELKRAGKTRWIGISVRSPDDGLAVAGEWDVDALQVNFNLADQRARQGGLLELCARQDIAVIVRTPLCFGFLTGAYGAQESFAASDHRSRWSGAQRRRWNEAQQTFADCLPATPGQTPAQLALRFCLSYPAITTVIPGMLTPLHVAENTLASDLGPLAADEMRRIEEVYADACFFLGK
jgi:aryl-alcohol dehydrogenase-like predicted oxidoreductase